MEVFHLSIIEEYTFDKDLQQLRNIKNLASHMARKECNQLWYV